MTIEEENDDQEEKEVLNPFAHGVMIPATNFTPLKAANTFLGFEDECIISSDRIVAVNFSPWTVNSFGLAYGQIHVYEEGNLQTDGYLSFDGILAVRDLPRSKVYEVRFNEEEEEWSDDYYGGKYECYGKKVENGKVILAKWGDCEDRQLVLTEAEYQELCEKIEQMPKNYGEFEHYKSRVRGRIRGEHRHLIEHTRRVRNASKRNQYGQRIIGDLDGWHKEIAPFDHGHGKVDHSYFLLGTPDVWTAIVSIWGIRAELREAMRKKKPSKFDWKDTEIQFIQYKDGVYVSQVRVTASQILSIQADIDDAKENEDHEEGGAMLLAEPHQHEDNPTVALWDKTGLRIKTGHGRFEEGNTAWFRSDVWQWIVQQTPEIESWYRATKDQVEKWAKEKEQV